MRDCLVLHGVEAPAKLPEDKGPEGGKNSDYPQWKETCRRRVDELFGGLKDDGDF